MFCSNLSCSHVETQKESGKRHAPITFDNKNGGPPEMKRQRSNANGTQKVYTPPSGKYSGRVRNYGGAGQQRQGGGGGGGMGRNRQQMRKGNWKK
ncbi:hypothetical protein DMENIID0001_035050 [Sergentomyia squamirostris]